MIDKKFTVVIVTYNRIECLKKALKCYEEQIYKPTCLIVVNNASTDGTGDYLSDWMTVDCGFEKRIITNTRNLGGAGGFAKGVEAALSVACDFVFLADDDAYADSNMLAKLNSKYNEIKNKDKIVALCTSVVNYGVYDFIHRRKIDKGFLTIKRVQSNKNDYKKDFFEIDEFSFVGVAIRTDIIKKVGLPREDYFIYFDDTEYSHRVGEYGKVICVPSSIMNHNVASGHDDNMVTWRSYYSLRNSLDVLKQYYPKRYFYVEATKHYIKRTTLLSRILKHRTSAEIKVLRTAIKDAADGRLGISEKYKPGKKI